MEKINVGIASIPDRIVALYETILSLYKQVDHFYVYLNNYEDIPSYLNMKKVKVFTSQAHGDLGDAGKFFGCGQAKGYYLTCDDDLIYPKDYVETMVARMKSLGNQQVVSNHGRNFWKLPVKSYYNSAKRIYHCLHEVTYDGSVQVGGTGVMCFHLDHNNFTIGDFPISYKNMADIHVANKLSQNDVRIWINPHKGGWIKSSKNFTKFQTIYDLHNKSDALQTKLINSIEFI